VRWVLSFLVFAFAGPAHALDERSVQECICEHGRTEVFTKSGTYVDCLLDDFAIEVDPSEKWAEALGQALHYALETDRTAKVVLFCDDRQEDDALCYRHALRLEATIEGYDLPVVVELHDTKSLAELCGF